MARKTHGTDRCAVTAEFRVVGWCWEDDRETEAPTSRGWLVCPCGLACEAVRVYVRGRLVEEASIEEYEARMADLQR